MICLQGEKMSSSIHAHQRRKTFIRCIRFLYVLRAGVQICFKIKGVQYMLSYYVLHNNIDFGSREEGGFRRG